MIPHNPHLTSYYRPGGELNDKFLGEYQFSKDFTSFFGLLELVDTNIFIDNSSICLEYGLQRQNSDDKAKLPNIGDMTCNFWPFRIILGYSRSHSVPFQTILSHSGLFCAILDYSSPRKLQLIAFWSPISIIYWHTMDNPLEDFIRL